MEFMRRAKLSEASLAQLTPSRLLSRPIIRPVIDDAARAFRAAL